MDLKKVLQIVRSEKHLSQKELANRIGITPQTYNAWENNPERLRIDQVDKIAAALKIPTSTIVRMWDI